MASKSSSNSTTTINSSHLSTMDSPKAQRVTKHRADPPERHSPLTLPLAASPLSQRTQPDSSAIVTNSRPRSDTNDSADIFEIRPSRETPPKESPPPPLRKAAEINMPFEPREMRPPPPPSHMPTPPPMRKQRAASPSRLPEQGDKLYVKPIDQSRTGSVPDLQPPPLQTSSPCGTFKVPLAEKNTNNNHNNKISSQDRAASQESIPSIGADSVKDRNHLGQFEKEWFCSAMNGNINDIKVKLNTRSDLLEHKDYILGVSW